MRRRERKLKIGMGDINIPIEIRRKGFFDIKSRG